MTAALWLAAAAAAAADDDDDDDDDDEDDVKLGQHLKRWLCQRKWRHVPTVPFVLYARLWSGVITFSGAAQMWTLFHVSIDRCWLIDR